MILFQSVNLIATQNIETSGEMFDVKKTQVFILVFVAFFVGTGSCNKHVKRSFDPRNHTAWPKDMESVCGISMSRNKIVGGRNAAIGDYPWQARIHGKKKRK